jgi:capsular polysaccharide transport system ATP-binding protein
MDTVVIEARQASKLLPHGVTDVRKAFVDLNLEVHHGQRLALFSGNAYESRSLLDCLSGIEPPDEGSVVHHGSVSWPVGTNQAFDKKLSGYINARFAAEIYSQPGRIDEDLQLIQQLADVDDHTFHEPLSAWKSGTRKSLELAVSLAFEFDVTVVGKISNWDHRARHPKAVRLRELFEQRIEGRTLLVAAPGQDELALDYCDEGLVIFDGRLAYRGDAEVCLEMVKEEALRLKAERRQRVNARVSRLLADDSDAEDDTDPDDDDPEMVTARSMLPS